MRGGVEALIWNGPPFELGEQRLEPIGVLVIDRERLLWACGAHLILDIRDLRDTKQTRFPRLR